MCVYACKEGVYCIKRVCEERDSVCMYMERVCVCMYMKRECVCMYMGKEFVCVHGERVYVETDSVYVHGESVCARRGRERQRVCLCARERACVESGCMYIKMVIEREKESESLHLW